MILKIMKVLSKIIPAFLMVLIFGGGFISCKGDERETGTATTTGAVTPTVAVKPRVIPPDFDMDSAYAYVKAQADMGPRVPGSRAHDKCVDYFRNFFKSCGADVRVEGGSATTFDNKVWRIDNVIVSFDPKNTNRLLLCAHYDSRPFADKDPKPENRTKPCPGVNDGASGAGVLMEIARAIKNHKPNIGIDIVLFDLEDYGENSNSESWGLGSQYWSKNAHKPAKYGVLLDMVGAKDAVFPKEGHSVFYAPAIVRNIWGAAKNLGYATYFIDQEYGEMTDDHMFINQIAQIPCVDILHYNIQTNSFFPHHHTTTDDINTIDKNTLKAVGQTLLEVIYNEE